MKNEDVLKTLCDCVCHIKGRMIMHFMACCENCQEKYLKHSDDGSIVIDYESQFILNLIKEGN